MGIASFILGIISIVMGWLPFICFFIDTIKKSKTNDKNKGFSIAGLIISAISIPIILIMSLVSIAIIVDDTEPDDIYNRYYDDYYDDDDDWLDDWYDQYYRKNRINDYKSF